MNHRPSAGRVEIEPDLSIYLTLRCIAEGGASKGRAEWNETAVLVLILIDASRLASLALQHEGVPLIWRGQAYQPPAHSIR